MTEEEEKTPISTGSPRQAQRRTERKALVDAATVKRERKEAIKATDAERNEKIFGSFFNEDDVLKPEENIPSRSTNEAREAFDKQQGFNQEDEYSFLDKADAAVSQTWLPLAAVEAADRSSEVYKDEVPLTELTMEDLNRYEEEGHSMEYVEYLLPEVGGIKELEARLAEDALRTEDLAKIGLGEGISAEGVAWLLAGSATDISTWAATLGVGKLATMAIQTAAVAKKAHLAGYVNKMNQHQRLTSAGAATVGSMAQGELDRTWRDQMSGVEDIALDAAIGAVMGGVFSGAKLPPEIHAAWLARNIRDSGTKVEDLPTDVRSEIKDFVTEDIQWKSDKEMRTFLESKAEQRASALAKKRYGSFSLYAQLSNSGEKSQELASYLFRDGIQGEKGVKQEHGLSERLVRRRERTQGIMLKSRMKHYRAYLLEKKRYAGKFSGLGLRRQPLIDFKTAVSKELRQGESGSAAAKAMASDLHGIYAEYLKRAKAKGFEWAENVTEGKYAPRMWSKQDIVKAFATDAGREAFIALLARNIEGLEGQDAIQFASLWANKMAKGEGAYEDISDIERFLSDTTSDTYKAFMAELAQKKTNKPKNKKKGKRRGRKKSTPTNFKYRIRLKDDASLTPFLENNFETVLMRYAGNMEGHFALAEDGLTMAQYKMRIDEAKGSLTSTGLKRDNAEAGLDYAYNLVAGNALSPNNAFARDYIRAGTGYTYTRLMGNMGIAQIGDFGTLASEMGYTTLLKNLPAIKTLFKTFFDGDNHYAMGSAVEELRVAMGNYGEARLMGSGRFDTDYGDEGGGLTYLIDSARQVTNFVNGFNMIDDYLRGVALDGVMLQWEKAATGKAAGLRLNKDRKLELGLDTADEIRLSDALYKHADNNDRGRITRLNLDRWENQKDVDLFLDATTRYLDKAVQRQHHGEKFNFVIGAQYQPLINVLMQFRSFIFAAQSSQFLRNLKHHDAQMFAQWLNGMLSGTMSYMFYLGAQSVARGDDFQEWYNKDGRSFEERLVYGAISRTGAWGIVPPLVDTARDIFGYEPIVSNRSSNLAGSFVSWEGSPMVSSVASGFSLGHDMLSGDIEAGGELIRRGSSQISNHFAFTALMNSFAEAFE